jgi:hypothetical protein
MQRHLSFAALLRLFMGCQVQSVQQPGGPDSITPHFYPPRQYYLQRK